MQHIQSVLVQTLEKEIGKPLALSFVEALVNASNGEKNKCIELYMVMGKQWASILVHWRNWIVSRALYRPVLIMRDAKPLSVLPISRHWQTLWLNRENCGIEDEIAGGEALCDPLLRAYLKQEHAQQPFTFIDTGCWGSIVEKLHTRRGLTFQPLFFFSHNPSIPGFLNEAGVSSEFGEVLNDSLECCFLNGIRRPSAFQKANNGFISPILIKEHPFICKLANAALEGIQAGVQQKSSSIKKAIDELERLHILAGNNVFTGILHDHSPTWSKGEQFLNDWPAHLCWT